MATTGRDLKDVVVGERALWENGPPHELFKELRAQCPVHWSKNIPEYPDEEGFWSITTADDLFTVTRDWKTFSSEAGGIAALTHAIPLELMTAMFIAQDPPKHDRVKALFQKGFTPRRIAEHEDRIRAIAREKLALLEGREECDLVKDFAQPVVSRVIGSFMGLPEEDDASWAELANKFLGTGDFDINPDGVEGVVGDLIPQLFARCSELVADRRENPTDDLTSVLVHAEVDGEHLEEHEIVMGFFLLIAAGNDSTKATFCSGISALLGDPQQMQLVLDDPELIPRAVEESLRMFPAFAHFRRTATEDVVVHGQEIKAGDKVVMWYVSSNRDETRWPHADRFDLMRENVEEHQAFGAGGRHTCLGMALARLELRVMMEEVLARYPRMELAGDPTHAVSPFINQLKTLPVRLNG
jgi:cholest-4-en-3-one 26-monooxygenase